MPTQLTLLTTSSSLPPKEPPTPRFLEPIKTVDGPGLAVARTADGGLLVVLTESRIHRIYRWDQNAQKWLRTGVLEKNDV